MPLSHKHTQPKTCCKMRGYLKIHRGLRGLRCDPLWQGFPAAFMAAVLFGGGPLAGHTMN